MEHNFCNQCGSKNIKGANYCSKCGEIVKHISNDSPETLKKPEPTYEAPISRENSTGSSFKSVNTFLNSIDSPKKRILLFILVALIGVFLLGSFSDIIGFRFRVRFLFDSLFDFCYDLIDYTIFSIFFCASLSVLFTAKINFKKIFLSFIGWAVIYNISLIISYELYDLIGGYTTLVRIFLKILAPFIAISGFNKKEIGKYERLILGFGWFIAMLMYHPSHPSYTFFIGIIISIIAYFMRTKNFKLVTKSNLAVKQKNDFSKKKEQISKNLKLSSIPKSIFNQKDKLIFSKNKKLLLAGSIIICLLLFASFVKFDCSNCNGSRVKSVKSTCSSCKGKGEYRCNYTTVVEYTWFGGGGEDNIYCYNGKLEGYRSNMDHHNGDVCPSCNGSARIECSNCDGYGYTNRKSNCKKCDGKGKMTLFGMLF